MAQSSFNGFFAFSQLNLQLLTNNYIIISVQFQLLVYCKVSKIDDIYANYKVTYVHVGGGANSCKSIYI